MMPASGSPAGLKALILPLLLAVGLISACSHRGVGAIATEAGQPDSALRGFVAEAGPADIGRLLEKYRSEYRAGEDTEDFLDSVLELYEACVAEGRTDLTGQVQAQLLGAEKDLNEVYGANQPAWAEHWRIRKTLADIRLEVLNQNLLTARQLLEDLLARYPGTLAAEHPLNKAVSRARLDLYSRLDLARPAVLTAWQILQHETSTRQRRQLHEQLWILIDTMNPFARQSLRAEVGDERLRIFIDVVAAWREKLGGNEQRWQNMLATHADHPAMEFAIPEALLAQEAQIENRPDKLALLLPLSGELAPVGQAIRDGFISAAWQQAQQRDMPLPVIDVYDTTVYGNNIAYVLEQALGGGAQLLVGPLRKEMVKKALGADLPVPIIALNYESDALLPGAPPEAQKRQIQMSLSDEDELLQIARLLDQLEVRSAGVLLPESRLGNRLKTFLEDYAALYGMRTNLVFGFYAPYEFDHGRVIRRMFGLDKSQQRFRSLRQRLNLEISFRPRRRGDIATVLVVADGQQMQSLYSQIRYQAQEPIPVITTSRSYALGKNFAADLDGLYMTLMPWLLSPTDKLASIERPWNRRYADFSYFFTFGTDAWDIANYYRPLLEIDRLRIPIHTGTVRLDEYGRLRREYAWARFAGGRTIEFDPADLKNAIDTPWIPPWKKQLLLD